MGNANFFGFSGTFLVKRESFRPTRTRKGGKWTQAWTSVEGREDGIAAQPNPAAILGP
jgi:hypothetical protein